MAPPPGTVLLTTIDGNIGLSPRYLTNVNGTLFFSADDGTHGRELWRSNGSVDGTASWPISMAVRPALIRTT